MLRRGALALILLLVALHPLAHDGELFSSRELSFNVELHDAAECPCVRAGSIEIAAPEIAERLAAAEKLVELARDGYASVDLSVGIPSRAPPSIG